MEVSAMPHPRIGYSLKSGQKVIGTTTICNRFKESGGLLQWAFQVGASGAESLYATRDQAGDVGTFVHAMFEALLSDKQAPAWPEAFTEEMRSQASRSLDAALRWKEDNNFKVTPL